MTECGRIVQRLGVASLCIPTLTPIAPVLCLSPAGAGV